MISEALIAIQLGVAVFGGLKSWKSNSASHPRLSLLQLLSTCLLFGAGSWELAHLAIDKSSAASTASIILHVISAIASSWLLYHSYGVLSAYHLEKYSAACNKADRHTRPDMSLTTELRLLVVLILIIVGLESGYASYELVRCFETSFRPVTLTGVGLSLLSSVCVVMAITSTETHAVSLWRYLHIDQPPSTSPVSTEPLASFLSRVTFGFLGPGSYSLCGCALQNSFARLVQSSSSAMHDLCKTRISSCFHLTSRLRPTMIDSPRRSSSVCLQRRLRQPTPPLRPLLGPLHW